MYLFDFSGSYFIPLMTSTALGLIATGFAAHLAFLKEPGVRAHEKSLLVETAARAEA